MDMHAQYEFYGQDDSLVSGQRIFLLKSQANHNIYPIKAAELVAEKRLFIQLTESQRELVLKEYERQLISL